MPDTPQVNELDHSTTDTDLLSETDLVSVDSEAPRLYGALKCCFYTPKRGDILGAFCLVFSGSSGEVLDNVFWVTRSYEEISIDIDVGWREMNKRIPEIGPYEKNLGERLLASLLDTFSPHVRMELIRHPDDAGQLAIVAEDLRKSFERAAHYFLEFNIALERLARKDLVEAGLLPEEASDGGTKTDSTDSDEEKKSFAGTLIHCLPIIDPVRGKAVSDLEPGDMVEVVIQSNTGAGGLIQQYLTSTKQDAIFPVASVEKKADEKIYIFLTVNEEIKGLITVTKDLRLRTLQTGRDRKNIPSISTDTLIFLGTFGTAIVVILSVIKYLFF